MDDIASKLVAVGVALLVTVAGIVASGILAVAALFSVGELGVVAQLVATIVLTFLGFALTVAGYLRYRGLGFEYVKAHVPSLRDLAWAAGGYVGAFVALFVGAFLFQFVNQSTGGGVDPGANQTAEILMQNPEIVPVFVVLSFLVIGPGEELLFRGLIQTRLREAFGPVASILLSASIFAAIHFFALTGGAVSRVATIGILFFPSLVFGATYERTANLVVPILIHGAYNATIGVIIFVSMTGGLGAGA